MTEEKTITIPIQLIDGPITIQIQFLWDKVEEFRKTHSDEETLHEVETNADKYIKVEET